jgi:hypothetical protein
LSDTVRPASRALRRLNGPEELPPSSAAPRHGGVSGVAAPVPGRRDEQGTSMRGA